VEFAFFYFFIFLSSLWAELAVLCHFMQPWCGINRWWLWWHWYSSTSTVHSRWGCVEVVRMIGGHKCSLDSGISGLVFKTGSTRTV